MIQAEGSEGLLAELMAFAGEIADQVEQRDKVAQNKLLDRPSYQALLCACARI